MISRRTAAGLLGAGLVSSAVVGAGLVRRRVGAQRAGGPEPTLGSLRGEPADVTTRDGVRLHAEVDEVADHTGSAAGDPGPTLVLVHGYALSLDSWHYQRSHFRGRYRLVLYDQRSHGRSGYSPPRGATLEQLGDDLHAVLDQLVPTGPVVLVGHSLGGMTIMALAEQHPELCGERVVGVALLATTPGGLKPSSLGLPGIAGRMLTRLGPPVVGALARTPGLVERGRSAASDLGYVVTRRFALGPDARAEHAEFVDAMLSRTPFTVVADFFPIFDALDMYAAMGAFAHVPTVVVCGEADRLTPVTLSRTMAELVTGAELVECPGAGHMVILEGAEEVNAAIERLVARTAPVPATRHG